MKKTIALMLAMLFALCAFATTAFADETTTVAPTTTEEKKETTTNDDVDDGFNETTTAKETTTKAADTTTTTAASSTTTEAGSTTEAASSTAAASTTELVGTLAPGQTAYEGQDQEGKETTTKKPAKVESAIPSTGSGVVVPAIALAVLAAGTVAVIKTKKED